MDHNVTLTFEELHFIVNTYLDQLMCILSIYIITNALCEFQFFLIVRSLNALYVYF